MKYTTPSKQLSTVLNFCFLAIKDRVNQPLANACSSCPKVIRKCSFKNGYGGFSLYTVFKAIRGDMEPESKYPTAWSWIVLIYIMNLFRKDAGMLRPDQSSFISAVRCFEEMGLVPNNKPGDLIRTSSKTSFKLMIPAIAEAISTTNELRPASEIPNFVESIKESIRQCRSESKHFLIIDGLDDILTKRDVQYDSLNALIFEANRLNQDFRKNNVPAKIILVCRTDLLDRLGGANKNKVRQDYAVELDWYKDTREPEKSDLIKIADKRATRSLLRSTKIFDEFLNMRIEDNDIRQTLLDMTRHTPRDFVELLTCSATRRRGFRNHQLNSKRNENIFDKLFFARNSR